MEFNVAQLTKERTGATRSYTVREEIENLDPEIVALDALSGTVQLMRTIDGVLATGVLTTSLGLVCDRCLNPFVDQVDVELEDEFKPSLDITTGASLPIAPEDEGNVIDEHHILNLHEVLRQRILLSQPIHPLCRSDCLGLCVNCGQNLNEGTCSCAEAEIDPRWAALRQLLH
jgi:uncharacterized protein